MNTSAAVHIGNSGHPDRWSLTPDGPLQHDARRVLIAVATADGVRVDQNFENTEAFLLYENDGCRTCFVGRQVCPRLTDGSESLRRARLLADCDLVLCANISDICVQKLSELGIDCTLAYAGATVSEAVSALRQGVGT